jgi:hypothetical protein
MCPPQFVPSSFISFILSLVATIGIEVRTFEYYAGTPTAIPRVELAKLLL